MKCLVIEDDENKAARIAGFLQERLPEIHIEIARSYISGLELLANHNFDRVLLDMTLPNYDIAGDEEGGIPNPYAGMDIVRQMQRRGILSPVIVITQYEKFGEGSEARTRDEIDAEMREKYSSVYRGLVYYHAAMEDWKDDLLTKMLP